jgi:cell shape-determining protein MreC
MLLRICLILTIVAGLATAYVGFFPVKDILTTTRAARDDFHTKLTAETALYQKTDKELKSTKATLAETTTKLNDTQAQLDTANNKNTELDKQNADLTDKLTKMTARADAAEQKLEQWRELPPPEAIRGIIAERDHLLKTRDALVAENKLLYAEYMDYDTRWNRIFGSDKPVVMTGLKGKILAVDPKYDFVVIDVGDEQGAKERGEMMVNRDGKLIGKVRITKVEKDRSVATILSQWKRGQVMEGDQVMY